MTFADLDWLSILTRTLVYIGAIGAAGGMLFYTTVPGALLVARTVRWQVRMGAILILCVEPLRYLQFQLAISAGDLALAFDPSMRWMAFETPIGQAAMVRVISALVLLIAGLRVLALGLIASVAVVASFALEGHSAAHGGTSWLPSLLLLLHLAVAHWWLGSLIPLRAITRHSNHLDIARLVDAFGARALAAVILLVFAGGVLMAILAGWAADLTRNHQILFIVKLFVFAAILTAAAVNKLRWTPLLQSGHERAPAGLRATLDAEITLCALILFVTAIMTSFSPANS